MYALLEPLIGCPATSWDLVESQTVLDTLAGIARARDAAAGNVIHLASRRRPPL